MSGWALPRFPLPPAIRFPQSHTRARARAYTRCCCCRRRRRSLPPQHHHHTLLQLSLVYVCVFVVVVVIVHITTFPHRPFVSLFGRRHHSDTSLRILFVSLSLSIKPFVSFSLSLYISLPDALASGIALYCKVEVLVSSPSSCISSSTSYNLPPSRYSHAATCLPLLSAAYYTDNGAAGERDGTTDVPCHAA